MYDRKKLRNVLSRHLWPGKPPAVKALDEAESLLNNTIGKVHFVKTSLSPFGKGACKALKKTIDYTSLSFSSPFSGNIIGLPSNLQDRIVKNNGRLLLKA